MTRHTRSEFNSNTRREALKRSNGYCECGLLARAGIAGFHIQGCGVRLVIGAIFYEHVNTDWHSSDNSLENAAVLTKTCWRKKTPQDQRLIAKTKRVVDRAFGTKSFAYRPLPGTIRSGIKLSLRPRSRPIDRETGREL